MTPRRYVALLALALFGASHLAGSETDDPYLWLEEVEGEKALAWAKAQSAATVRELEAVPEFDALHDELVSIFTSRRRIPIPRVRGAWIYNFWQDDEHVRGIWRRTFLDQYVAATPAWETVLDLDALAAAEGENWVWRGAQCLPPDHRHCLVTLSRGGSDAAVEREFDAAAKRFVADGFVLPEAKARVGWQDEDTLWVATDFGEGSLTTSGYPRVVSEWKRGTKLEDAELVFAGNVEDVAVAARSLHTPEGRYDIVERTPSFFSSTTHLRLGGRLVKLDLPEDVVLHGMFEDRMLIGLRSDWDTGDALFEAGSLLAIDLDDFLAGGRAFEILFAPAARLSLDQVSRTRNHVLYTTLDNVRGRLYRLTLGKGGWSRNEIELPGLGTVDITSTADLDDTFFFTYTDFLTPSSLYLVRDGQPPERIKSSPSWFDAEGMAVEQHEAVSRDGTRIPYFVWKPRDFEADGSSPTLLYGYGGFEISMQPGYSGEIGSAWVARGGVYVLANIRGGGEFGPDWHKAAVQEKHQANFDDFTAVARDLVARNITSPAHLGIYGGSQGGLLVGGSFVQAPELFEAVVCFVPLLDMKRYNKLLAGASWMAEYGNPDTEDWAYIKTWSPYHNLDPEKDYPRVFFATSTRDDRVHPGHARKMVAKMQDMGKPVLYYENTEGGHAAAANLDQRAYMAALRYAYLWKMLAPSARRPPPEAGGPPAHP